MQKYVVGVSFISMNVIDVQLLRLEAAAAPLIGSPKSRTENGSPVAPADIHTGAGLTPLGRGGGLPVPDLTFGAGIKLNTRLSLQRDLKSIACLHPAITEAAARYSTRSTAVTRHPVAYLEVTP
jgi:hypothetical protein